MEYVAGKTLAERIHEQGRLGVDDARSVVGQVAAALAAAHAADIVHRGVKPSNILITDRGLAKLADFGVARQGSDATLTQTGLVIGTPAYLAPEVAQGAPSPASDVWSLGATLFASVEGEPPFTATSSDPLTVLVRIVSAPAPAAQHAGALQPLLARMLDQQPARRPSAAEAADRLRTTRGVGSSLAQSTLPTPPIVAAPTLASRPAPVPTTPLDVVPAGRPRWPWRWIALAAGVAILVAVAALLLTRQGTTNRAQSSRPPPAPASSSSHSAPTPSTTPVAGNPMTAPTMRQFVQNYYALIPGNLQTAFEQLGPGLSAQGFDAYRAWWSQFSSVDVTPLAADPAAGTVTIRLSAVRANGSVARDTEKLTSITSPDRAHLLINNSQVVAG